MADSTASPIAERTERTLSQYSTFRPHRPAPLPLSTFDSREPDSSLHSVALHSPPYASYSRPRRDSLTTLSPTPPPRPPASPPSYPRNFRPLPQDTLHALRRRDIVHPSKFQGAVVVGFGSSQSQRSPVSTSSAESDGRLEDLVLKSPSSVETAATSIVEEDDIIAHEEGLSGVNHGVNLYIAPKPQLRSRKVVNFVDTPSSRSPTLPSARPATSKSFGRIFSLKRTTTAAKWPLLRRGRSADGNVAAEPVSSIADSRPRDISLPPPVESLRTAPTKKSIESERNQEKTDETHSEPGPQACIITDRTPPPPAVGEGDHFADSRRIEGEIIRFEPSLDLLAAKQEEEEVLGEFKRLTRRHSIASQLSSTTSVAAYRSFFDMFASQERLAVWADLPRADSVTVPDLRSWSKPSLPASSATALYDGEPRPDSPTSIYPPTISISPSAEEELKELTGRRKLFGPRPPFLDQYSTTTAAVDFRRHSTTSTVVSGFVAFPFPPNFSVQTPPPPPPPPPPPTASAIAPLSTTSDCDAAGPSRAGDTQTRSPGRALQVSELKRFLAS